MKDGAGKNRILFSNANSMEERKSMTVKISYDEGTTWPEQKTIYTGSAAYSSLSMLQNGDRFIFRKRPLTSRMVLFSLP
jgi:sialidase-1